MKKPIDLHEELAGVRDLIKVAWMACNDTVLVAAEGRDLLQAVLDAALDKLELATATIDGARDGKA